MPMSMRAPTFASASVVVLVSTGMDNDDSASNGEKINAVPDELSRDNNQVRE